MDLGDFVDRILGIKSIKDLISFIVLILLGYVAKQTRAILARRKVKEHMLEYASNIDSRITQLITEMRVRLSCDRTYFSQFHNGEYTTADNPVLRKTRTHESVRPGMAYQQEVFKGMLVSHMADEVKLVLDKGHSFTRVEDLPAGKFKWLCVEYGIKAIARCAVVKAGKTVGFLGADFGSTEMPENVEILCEYAQRVSEII